METLKRVGIILVVIGLIYGVQQINKQPIQQKQPAQQTQTTQTAAYTVNPTDTANFMSGCTSDGGTQSQCSCMWNQLSSKYSVNTMISFYQSYQQTGVMPVELSSIATSCQNE